MHILYRTLQKPSSNSRIKKGTKDKMRSFPMTPTHNSTQEKFTFEFQISQQKNFGKFKTEF